MTSASTVVAPHPFFPTSSCLGRDLERHADLFDAVERNAMVLQQKTPRPVQFEITEQTRTSLEVYEYSGRLALDISWRPHLSTRQYARLVHRWVESVGLESVSYGTHSMRRTKATQIYRKTGNLRAVQLLLGHTKLESTVRYLGIEVDDALQIAEQIEL